MTLRTIAFSSLRRRKARAAFLVAGLLIGIGTVVALYSLTSAMTGHARSSMQSYGANIVITPKSEQVALTYDGMDIGGLAVDAREIGAADLARIDTIPDRRAIAVVAPELVGGVEVDGRRVLLMGVHPREEFKLKRWWSVDAGRPPQNGRELVAGAAAARALGLQMGDYVRIGGRRFTVTGLLRETGSQDDDLLIVDLAAAQEILHKPGKVTLVEIAAADAAAPTDAVVAQLSAALPGAEVTAVQEVVQSSLHTVDRFRVFSYAIVGVVIVIELLVVFITMMGSVNERTREIGVFRALGFTSGHVTRLILIEAVTASLLAGVLGYAAGMATSVAVLPAISEGAQVTWTVLPAVGAVLLSLLIGASATLYPARHASRLDPTEALRAL
jgi:putative ABC transport system permease protein